MRLHQPLWSQWRNADKLLSIDCAAMTAVNNGQQNCQKAFCYLASKQRQVGSELLYVAYIIRSHHLKNRCNRTRKPDSPKNLMNLLVLVSQFSIHAQLCWWKVWKVRFYLTNSVRKPQKPLDDAEKKISCFSGAKSTSAKKNRKIEWKSSQASIINVNSSAILSRDMRSQSARLNFIFQCLTQMLLPLLLLLLNMLMTFRANYTLTFAWQSTILWNCRNSPEFRMLLSFFCVCRYYDYFANDKKMR